MRDVLLKDLAIAGLEYVFKPPGLPLIAKTSQQTPSTSILVRGGPGTGKSTLATALVHAIAKRHGGTALYLTTEFVPTEILYKARLLGLPDERVMEWGTEGELEPGTILVEHLLRLERGAEVTNSIERKLAALEAVWDMLDPDTQPHGQVRAVAIDAFGLPDSESEESALRNDLLALVQTLEGMGISTVLIEEASGGASHWLPFVTDIVFELSLDQDPDTGELIRKLTCPKSRYAVSLPGPHDYGLKNRKPQLWPDLLAVIQDIEPTEPISQPGFFLPLDAEEYVACKRGVVMVSVYGHPSLAELDDITPGVHSIQVDCGPLTRVWLSPAQDEDFTIPANEGPFSLGWALLRLAAANKSNRIVFQRLEFFLSRVRFRSSILHVLQALGDFGLFVMVHGPEDELRPVVPITEYVADGSSISGAIRHRIAPDRVRSASLSLHGLMSIHSPLSLQKPEQESAEMTLEQQVRQLSEELIRGQVSVESAYQNVQEARSKSKGLPDNILMIATMLHMLGQDDVAKAEVSFLYRQTKSPPSKSLTPQRARYQLRMADDLRAAQSMLTLVDDPLLASVQPLWRGLCAIYGQNDIALSELEQDERTTTDPDALGLYLRALAVRDRVGDMDRAVTEAGEQHDLPSWFVTRLQADLRLESQTKDLVREAAARLEKLSTSSELPPVHAAEVFYNLGIARERLDQPDKARAAYQRARDSNPRLQAATRKLEKSV